MIRRMRWRADRVLPASLPARGDLRLAAVAHQKSCAGCCSGRSRRVPGPRHSRTAGIHATSSTAARAVGSFPISIPTPTGSEPTPNCRDDQALRPCASAASAVLPRRRPARLHPGIDARLRNYELLLGSGRLTVEDVCLMQIAVPSRERVSVRRHTRADRAAGGRINGSSQSRARSPCTIFPAIVHAGGTHRVLRRRGRDGGDTAARRHEPGREGYVACRPEASGQLI